MNEISTITSEISHTKPLRRNSTSSLLSTTLENTLENDDSLKVIENSENVIAASKAKEKNILTIETKTDAAKNYTNSVYEKILDKYLNKSFMNDNSDLKVDTQFENLFCVRI